MNIYIGNFSYDTTMDDLQEIFSAFGHVETVKIIRDKYTGDSKGFGFVTMPNKKEAEAAIIGIAEIKGRRISINEARPMAHNNSFKKKRGGPKNNNYGRRSQRY